MHQKRNGHASKATATPAVAFVASQSALGKRLKPPVSRNTILRYLALGMPAAGPDGYDVGASQAWKDSNIDQKRNPTNPGSRGLTDETKADLERRKLQIEVETRELKLAKMRGELVERAAIHAWNRQTFARLKARLEQIPDECGASIPSELQPELVEDFRNKIHLALKELASPELEIP